MRIYEEIKRNGRNIIWWRNRIFYKVVFPLIFKKENWSIFDEDWDVLIILDACRYDIFKNMVEELNLSGKLEYRYSKGSDTTEFLYKNFMDTSSNHYKDIVYITANPFVSIILKDRIYRIIPVWDFGWNNKFKTVLPKTMYYYTLKYLSKYPNKKFIIHFIQPHYPYISYRKNDRSLEELRSAVLRGKRKTASRLYNDTMLKIFGADIYAMIDESTHKSVYTTNLRMVLHYVKRLINFLRGKIVITADHGEAFGEKIHPLIPIRVYGHPQSVRIPALVKVPWFVVDEIKNEINIKELKREINRMKPKSVKGEKDILKERISKLRLNQVYNL